MGPYDSPYDLVWGNCDIYDKVDYLEDEEYYRYLDMMLEAEKEEVIFNRLRETDGEFY